MPPRPFHVDRRAFLRLAGAAGAVGAAGLAAASPAAGLAERTGTRPCTVPGAPGTRPAPLLERPSTAPLSILVLGGTGFIGPFLVEHALSRGHRITLFNRGRTNTDLFPNVEKLVGDRNDDLSALEGRRWDAVLDNSGYTPDQVRLSGQVLRNATSRYLFTSTRAVYREFLVPGMDEDAVLGPDLPEVRWEGYGPLKALAEREARQAFGDRCTIVRPPIIVGPQDRSDRFTYWVDRIDDGGEVLAPGNPSDPVRYIDVRDLAEFYVRLLEDDTPGAFNAAAPESILTVAEMLYGIRAVTSAPVSFTWVDADFLMENGVMPSDQFPFWQYPRGPWLHHGRISNARAIAAGLRFRPLAVTATDTLAWHRTRPFESQETLRAGISRAREAELLEAWKRR